MERLNDDWFSTVDFALLLSKKKSMRLNLFRNNPLDLPALLLRYGFSYSWFIKESVCVRQLLSQYPVLEQLIVNRKFYQARFCNIA
jgi:hypothetical protein